MSIATYIEMGTELKNFLSLQRPLGMKFCLSEEEIPPKAKRPLRDFNIHMGVCQAVNTARNFGYTVGMTLEDMFCLPGASVFGLMDFDYSFYPHHVKDETAGRKLDQFYHERNRLLPKDKYKAVVFSPLDRLMVEPDIIIVFGSPAQIAKISKAFTWHGETVSTLFAGGLGCSTYAAVFVEKKPLMKLAAGGEKIMAGTGEYEVDICFPAERLPDVLEGLKGTQRMLPYPMICTTLLNEPVVPEDYKITYRELANQA